MSSHKPKLYDDTADILRGWFPRESTALTTLEKVSASGMTRHIRVFALGVEERYRATKANGGELYRTREAAGPRARVEHVPQIIQATRTVAALLGYRVDDNDGGIIVKGCGMDMGFHIVYGLSATLYGHKNGGGYAISHRWI